MRLLCLVIGLNISRQFFKPMRGKSKTNRTLYVRFFPLFKQVTIVIGSSRCLLLLWLVEVITLLLDFQQSSCRSIRLHTLESVKEREHWVKSNERQRHQTSYDTQTPRNRNIRKRESRYRKKKETQYKRYNSGPQKEQFFRISSKRRTTLDTASRWRSKCSSHKR